MKLIKSNEQTIYGGIAAVNRSAASAKLTLSDRRESKGQMGYIIHFFCVVIMLVICPLALSFGQETQKEDASVDTKLVLEPEQTVAVPSGNIFEQRISLDLRNIDILESLKFLAAKIGLNMIVTKGVTGRITLTVENAVAKDVFDIMLRSNGLAYVLQGDIYNVMTEAEYKTLYGKNFYDNRQVKVFRLKYAVPEQAFNLLDALKSDIGRVLVDQEAGNAMIMDTPEKISQIEKSLEEFEKKNKVEVFPLKYAKAKDVEDILKAQLDVKRAGYIKADERNNQVIVQALSERMQEIEQLIRDLDKKTKEVLIDTQIVKIKLSDQVDSGVQWEGLFDAGQKYGMSYLGSYPFSSVQSATAAWRSRPQVLTDAGGIVGAYPFSGTTSNQAASNKMVAGEAIHFGVVDSKRDFDVLVKYLQTVGKTKILSNPKLVVVNNQEAKIHVGEKQAYVTTTTTSGQTTNTISEEVTFVDVGIQFAVTPTINDDGYITMKVKPEISSVTSTLITPTNNRIPIIDTSLTETTVLIKDGTTLIIGGLRREEKTNIAEQFPFLGKLPLLGFLFRSATNKVDRTELLVMITPHIISGNELTTGNERGFGDKPGKDYRDYQGIAAGGYQQSRLEDSPFPIAQAITGSVPQGVGPKSYRYNNLDSKKIEDNKQSPAPQVKGVNYETYLTSNIVPADVTIKGQKP